MHSYLTPRWVKTPFSDDASVASTVTSLLFFHELYSPFRASYLLKQIVYIFLSPRYLSLKLAGDTPV